jgi:DNA invertase Pin-like site-specific DNA recombinase
MFDIEFMFDIAGYARVSTQDQAENSHALEQQIARLKSAGAQKVYFDVESGANPDRPQFEELLSLVKEGKVKQIIATRWDRLMRHEVLYLQVKQILQESGVKLRLLDSGAVDFSTAAGELSADMQALFSVHERRSTRERVLRGYEHRRKRLAAGIRPPWGYTIVGDKYQLNQVPCICLLEDRPKNYLELYHEPDDSNKLLARSKADIAKEAADKFIELKSPRQVLNHLYQKYGVPVKKNPKKKKLEVIQDSKKNKLTFEPSIADELLFWSSPEGLRNWLANPVLKGDTAYLRQVKRKTMRDPSGWEIHPATHLLHRLIDDEEALEIRKILETNTKKICRPNAIHYLTGHIFCKTCGGKCILKRGSGYAYYGCRHASVFCDNRKNARIEKIEQSIIWALVDRANQLALLVNESHEVSLCSTKLTGLKEQLAHLENIPGADDSPHIREAIAKLNREIKQLSRQLESEIPGVSTIQEILHHPVSRQINFWYTLTQRERETFYERLVGKVLIQEGAVVSVELQV